MAIARGTEADPRILGGNGPRGDLDGRSGKEGLTRRERLKKGFHRPIVRGTHAPHAAERAHTTRHLDKGELQ